MSVRVETNKKEAIGVAPFLDKRFCFQLFARIGVLANLTIQPRITSYKG